MEHRSAATKPPWEMTVQLLGAQAWITRRWAVGFLAVAIIACCVVLALSDQVLLVVGVQVSLILLVVAVSIPVLRRLHDAVSSSIRAGVASGVGTLTWLMFVPFALVFGAVSERAGVDKAGWLLVAIAAVAALLVIVVLPQAPAPVGEAVPVVPVPAQEGGAGATMNDSGSGTDDLRCIEFVSLVTAYLDGEVDEQQRRRIDQHLEGCRGCRAALNQFQTVVRLAGRLTAADVADVDPLLRDRLTATLRAPRRH